MEPGKRDAVEYDRLWEEFRFYCDDHWTVLTDTLRDNVTRAQTQAD